MIQLPEDLKKPIDEIKTPSNKILIICLILSIIFLGTFIVVSIRNSDKDCAEQKAAQDLEIKRLNKYIIEKSDEENKRLKNRQEYFDSVNNLLNKLK